MRDLIWVGSSLADLKRFPDQVMSDVGHTLYFAQCGVKHEHAKPLKGCGLCPALLPEEEPQGGKVPKPEQALIESRLRDAMMLDRSRDGQKG